MNSYKLFAAVLVLPLLVSGCATEPTQTERNFGDSVRQMIRAQAYDPSTLDNPSETPVEGTDGRRAESVLETYRTDVYKPATGGRDVVVSVDEGR